MQGTESEPSLQPHTVATDGPPRSYGWLRLILLSAVVAAFGNGLFGLIHSDALTGAPSHRYLLLRHGANILLHGLSALCLFDLLLHILRRPALRHAHTSDATWLAFATSLFWALHPIHTESVTYLSHPSALLSTVLSLTAVWVFCKKSPSLPTRSLYLYFGGLAILIILLDFIRQGLNEAPSGAASAAVLLSPLDYWLNQQAIAWHYLQLWFSPMNLCLDYLWLPAPRESLYAIAGANILIGIGVLVGASRRWHLAMALGTAILLWLPSSSVIPFADLAAERRLYLPSIPLCLVCVTLAGRSLNRGLGHSNLATFTRVCAIMAVAFVLALLTYDRNRVYNSHSLMQRDILSTSPHNLGARLELSVALCDEGQLDQAYTASREALEWMKIVRHETTPNPIFIALAAHHEPGVLRNLGRIFLMQGETEQAVRALRQAVHLQPNDDVTFCNLAVVHYRQGYYDLAIQAGERAVYIDPSYARPHAIMGMCYIAQQRPDLAQEMFDLAHSLDPKAYPSTGTNYVDTLEIVLP